ncbi:MAG: hypothetical protein ACI9E1_000668 [Cryomorphaceae bacterium]|jgi:hypothetical protein
MDKMTGEFNNNESVDLKPVAFWQLHKNPILLRYLRSRLRWNGLSAALILTLVITIFTFVISYNTAVKFAQESNIDAYRAAFLPMFLIQVIIMMFLGTGSVASGITQEYEDGMVDYQRLTPMSPMAKILGYLFGLPIREWFLFAVTSVFIGIIVVKGQVPMGSVWRVYSVFFVSIILYHLMALVVVHSMKKKRVAGRVIQLLVVVLYLVFPLLSQFGLVFFEYLTVRPILKENMLEYIPKGVNMRRLLDLDGGATTVPFFDQQLNAWSFSMIIMSSLTVSFLLMLCRRWKDVTSHLMSKPFALMFFGFLMFFLIGNTLPIAKEGEMSITKNFIEIREKSLLDRIDRSQGDAARNFWEKRLKRFREKTNKTNSVAADAPVAQTVFGSICVLFACLVVYIVTPRNEKYLLGLRRARNLKKKWIPFHWDEAPGMMVTISVMVMLMVSLFYFSTTLYNAPTMPTKIRELIPFIPVVCLFAAVVVLVFYLVYEAWENKGLFLLLLVIWVLPIMVALVVAVQSNHYPTLVWVSCVSPIAAYGYGMTDWVVLPVREAFFCSFGLQVLIGGFAALALYSKKMSGRKVMLENPVD